MSKEGLGKLLWYSSERGVGEIRTDEGHSHFFVASEMKGSKRREPRPGEWLYFQIASFMIFGRPAAVAVERATAQLSFDRIKTADREASL